MATPQQHVTHSCASEIQLRPAVKSDLPIFFEHQREPEANKMAAFPARDRDDFMAHWTVPRSLPLVCYGDNLDPSFGHAKHNEERKALH